jgi:hypothetical protein
MTEVEVNGTGGLDLDASATKAALASASTSLRLGSLHALEERLSNNGTERHLCTVLSAHLLIVVRE